MAKTDPSMVLKISLKNEVYTISVCAKGYCGDRETVKVRGSREIYLAFRDEGFRCLEKQEVAPEKWGAAWGAMAVAKYRASLEA